jgi:hypothetical protein
MFLILILSIILKNNIQKYNNIKDMLKMILRNNIEK